jgi:hypothetical protein
MGNEAREDSENFNFFNLLTMLFQQTLVSAANNPAIGTPVSPLRSYLLNLFNSKADPDNNYSNASLITETKGKLDIISIRKTISKSFEQTTKELDDYKYKWGADSDKRKQIDCSNFMSRIFKNCMRDINGTSITDAESNQLNNIIDAQVGLDFVKGRISEWQMEALKKYKVPVISVGYKGSQLETLQKNNKVEIASISELKDKIHGGMIITMDTGRKGWDAGRPFGSNHIVGTYEDENGNVMVCESGTGGVKARPLDQWLKGLKSTDKLQIVDMVDLIEAKNDRRMEFKNNFVSADKENANTLEQGYKIGTPAS